MSEQAWSETDSADFAALGEIFTPGRDEIARVLVAHVPAEPDEAFLAVEIGCGTGWLSEAVVTTFPRARVRALDGSPEMLRLAGERLAHHAERVELRRFTLEDPDWPGAIGKQVRCFLSSLVLHHLDASGKQALFRQVHERLAPGGGLLVADLVAPASELGRRYAARAWADEVHARSLALTGNEDAARAFAEMEWNWFDYPDPIDMPSPLADQLGWLHAAGYTGVDVPWARAGHAVICAYRAD